MMVTTGINDVIISNFYNYNWWKVVFLADGYSYLLLLLLLLMLLGLLLAAGELLLFDMEQ